MKGLSIFGEANVRFYSVSSLLGIWLRWSGCSVIAHEVTCVKWVKIYLECQCWLCYIFSAIRSHHQIVGI